MRKWFNTEKFKQYNRLPVSKRLNEVVREIVQQIFMHYGVEVTGKERIQLHQ